MTFPCCAVKHTDQFGHIVLIKVADGEFAGNLLPIYVGASESASCSCCAPCMVPRSKGTHGLSDGPIACQQGPTCA